MGMYWWALGIGILVFVTSLVIGKMKGLLDYRNKDDALVGKKSTRVEIGEDEIKGYKDNMNHGQPFSKVLKEEPLAHSTGKNAKEMVGNVE